MPAQIAAFLRNSTEQLSGARRMSGGARRVFIAGATGYMGTRLAEELKRRGLDVAGLVRPGSEQKLPAGCMAIPGNALDRATFIETLGGADTFVQLVGVA